ncbi:MAG: hypothetical protein STSR0006_01770 [Lentimicrobium sp.]
MVYVFVNPYSIANFYAKHKPSNIKSADGDKVDNSRSYNIIDKKYHPLQDCQK